MSDQKKYLETHPFLAFQPDLRQAKTQFWMLLGEAKSKCEHLTSAPLLPSVSREMHTVYLAKGIQATTAIEGNTLSEEDVRKIIDKQDQTPGSREYQKQEIENILAICNTWLNEDHGKPVTEEMICNFNRLLLQNLEVDEHVIAGEYTTVQLGVGSYRPPAPEHIPQLMREFVVWLGGFDLTPYGEWSRIHFAILKSILAHLYLAWIHPFGDGNGRTSRLLEWYILLSAGVPSPATHLLSNHYNLTRDRYYRELNKAGKTNDVNGFLLYALEGFVDGLKEQIQKVQEQQTEVMMIHQIHRQITGTSSAQQRRKDLAIAITRKGEGFYTLDDIFQSALRLYPKPSTKIISRDIKALLDAQLIEKRGNTYSANWDLVLGMLPKRHPAP